MSVQITASRPAGKSVGAAGLGIVLTLLIFVVSFVAFLIAPLLLLLVAFVAYTALRPRDEKSGSGSAGPASTAHGFGAGTQ